MKHLLPILLVLLVAATLNASTNLLDLHLEPDATSRRISQVMPDDTRLGTPAPYGSAGWYKATFTRTLSGYVHQSNLGDNGQPVRGAALFQWPMKESPNITTVIAGDTITVKTKGEWSEVLIERQSEVFYLAKSPPVPLLPEIAQAPAPQMTRSPSKSNPTKAPVISEPLTQSFSGRFLQAKPRFGLLDPKVPFVLENEKGKRIAFVDTDAIVVAGSLQSYLGKPVVVHGRLEKLPDSRQWVIRAQHIRIR